MKKNKIRILHVAQAAGGVDRYIRMLLKYLQKKEEHDSLRLSCGAGENADDGGDGSDSSFGVYHV